jgi:hypothetical protein
MILSEFVWRRDPRHRAGDQPIIVINIDRTPPATDLVRQATMIKASGMASRAVSALGALVLLLAASRAAGQSAPAAAVASAAGSGGDAVLATLTELRRTIAVLQQTVDQQGQQIAELYRALEQPAPATPAVFPALTVYPASASAQSSREDQPGQRTPELPPDVVTAGDFPGSFTIPGSDAALKIGGLVRVNWVSTNNALIGVDDRFVTSAIPVEGVTGGAGGARVDVIAGPSRFNFDLRTPTGVGQMRAFIEGDFAGANGTLRLRHAYGQWRRIIFGQTWSTYSDPEAEPAGIDFEGLNAIVLLRQPQARWTFAPGERTRVAVAFEDPRAELTGADSVSQVPDVVARFRFEPTRGGHVQVAGVLRQLRGQPLDQPTEIVGSTGYGLNVSGRIPIPALVPGTPDALLFQSNSGAGIGHYITDLSTLGGQDAIYNPQTRSLDVLNVFSGYVGYEHAWTQRLRSALTFGIVNVSNVETQPGDALHLTRRYSFNFMWSPIARMDLVTELLWGSRTNRDGKTGTAAQTQVGATFRF